jgi:hypothetical protein
MPDFQDLCQFREKLKAAILKTDHDFRYGPSATTTQGMYLLGLANGLRRALALLDEKE